MSINLTVVNNKLIVWGTTYEIREEITSLGGVYDSKLNVWKLPRLDIEETRKKLTDALDAANKVKSSLKRVPSLSEHLSIRKAKSVYALPKDRPILPSYHIRESPVKEVIDPPTFFVQSVAEEIAEARSPNRSRRSSGTSSRRSSYGSTQTAHLFAQEILSPQILVSPLADIRRGMEEVKLAKKNLRKYSSIEYSATEYAQRGQRGIEEACRALLDVDDLYRKERELDEALFNS